MIEKIEGAIKDSTLIHKTNDGVKILEGKTSDGILIALKISHNNELFTAYPKII